MLVYASARSTFRHATYHPLALDCTHSPRCESAARVTCRTQIAVLRAIRAASDILPGISRKGVHLIGDSAGANLIMHAALILANSELRAAFFSDFAPDLMPWAPLPCVHSVIPIYGMMDDEDTLLEAPLLVSFGLSFMWRAHAGNYSDASTYGIGDQHAALALVKRPSSLRWMRPTIGETLQKLIRLRTVRLPPSVRGCSGVDSGGPGVEATGRSAPTHDVSNDVTLGAFKFPRCFLCCGSSDFLLPSSHLIRSRLLQLESNATLRTYPGPHGFFGLPPGWTWHR